MGNDTEVLWVMMLKRYQQRAFYCRKMLIDLSCLYKGASISAIPNHLLGSHKLQIVLHPLYYIEHLKVFYIGYEKETEAL